MVVFYKKQLDQSVLIHVIPVYMYMYFYINHQILLLLNGRYHFQ